MSTDVRLYPAAFKRVVVFFANALGDHLMALPTLRALSSAFDGRLTLATAQSPTDLLLGDVRCERVVQLPIRWIDGVFDTQAAAEALGPTDLFISVNYWHNPSVTALIEQLRSAVTVGFNPQFGRPLVADPSRHHIDQVFQVCKLLGVSDRPEDHSAPFPLPAASLRFAERIRATLDGSKLLVVHPRSKPAKTWPLEAVNQAVVAFLDQRPEFTALVVAKHESELADLTPRAIPLAGIPLASAAAVIAASDLFLGVDSFPLHVADLWRRPGLGLFGPTASTKWGYRFTPQARHLDGNGTMAGIDPAEAATLLSAIARETAPSVRSNFLNERTAPDVTLRYR